jgi:hypothetical protein
VCLLLLPLSQPDLQNKRRQQVKDQSQAQTQAYTGKDTTTTSVDWPSRLFRCCRASLTDRVCRTNRLLLLHGLMNQAVLRCLVALAPCGAALFAVSCARSKAVTGMRRNVRSSIYIHIQIRVPYMGYGTEEIPYMGCLTHYHFIEIWTSLYVTILMIFHFLNMLSICCRPSPLSHLGL